MRFKHIQDAMAIDKTPPQLGTQKIIMRAVCWEQWSLRWDGLRFLSDLQSWKGTTWAGVSSWLCEPEMLPLSQAVNGCLGQGTDIFFSGVDTVCCTRSWKWPLIFGECGFSLQSPEQSWRDCVGHCFILVSRVHHRQIRWWASWCCHWAPVSAGLTLFELL